MGIINLKTIDDINNVLSDERLLERIANKVKVDKEIIRGEYELLIAVKEAQASQNQDEVKLAMKDLINYQKEHGL